MASFNVKYFHDETIKEIKMTEIEMSALKKEFNKLKEEETIISYIEKLLTKALAVEKRLNAHTGTSNGTPDREGVAAIDELYKLFPQIKRLFTVLEAEERKTSNFTIELRNIAQRLERSIKSSASMLFPYSSDEYKVSLH